MSFLQDFTRIDIQPSVHRSTLSNRPYITVSSASIGFSKQLVNELKSPAQIAFYKGQSGSVNENKIAIVPCESGGSQFLSESKAHQECKKKVELRNKQILQVFQENLLMDFGVFYLVDAEIVEEGDERYAVVDMSKATENRVGKHRK